MLVPNERGLDRALDAGVEHVAIFASATESFAQRNLNRTLDAQFAMFEPVVERALAAGLRVRGYVSMCFGDPWEGAVAPEQVAAVGRRLVELGCAQLSLGDTIGTGTPGHVDAVLDACVAAGVAGGAARGALPRHLRAGAGQHAGRAAPRGDHRGRQRRRPRRLPVRRVGHRQPGHRGPGLDARRARHRARRRPGRAGRDQRLDGRAAGPAVAVPGGSCLARLTPGDNGVLHGAHPSATTGAAP